MDGETKCLTLNLTIMAVVSSPLLNEARGKLGNVIIYSVNGQVRFRSKPMQHKDCKSKGQLKQRGKMKGVMKTYRYLDFTFLYSWKERTKDMIMNGCNLFVKENIGHFNDAGEIEPCRLKISTGTLPVPENILVERDENGEIVLTWDNDQNLSGINGKDYLLIGIYGNRSKIRHPVIYSLDSIRSLRKDCQCSFRLPQEKGIQHVYCCFKSQFTNEYSDSVYLGSWEAVVK